MPWCFTSDTERGYCDVTCKLKQKKIRALSLPYLWNHCGFHNNFRQNSTMQSEKRTCDKLSMPLFTLELRFIAGPSKTDPSQTCKKTVLGKEYLGTTAVTQYDFLSWAAFRQCWVLLQARKSWHTVWLKLNKWSELVMTNCLHPNGCQEIYLPLFCFMKDMATDVRTGHLTHHIIIATTTALMTTKNTQMEAFMQPSKTHCFRKWSNIKWLQKGQPCFWRPRTLNLKLLWI